jgi:twinkle protein
MTLAEDLAEHNIRPKDFRQGDQKLLCPQCSHNRKNKTDPCLSLTIGDDSALWKCHNCEWSGGIRPQGDRGQYFQERRRDPVRITTQPQPLPAHAIAWFASRGISEDSLEHAGVGWSEHRKAVAFPVRRPGESAMVNCKFRRLPKDGFSQIKDGEKLYWLLDKLVPIACPDLYIVEGEIDALSLIEAGITNVVSVPDGAPKTVGEGDQHAKKFSYVPDSHQWVEPFERIILAVDADGPGQALAEELARRYGKEKCWRVEWPEGLKDANEYLIQHGKAALGEFCRRPRPWPVAGLFDVQDYASEVMALFDGGHDNALSTGLPSLDQLYKIVPGHLAVVTGVPNHGKSEFIDQLMVNLARKQGWTFGLCSFENDPPNHIAKLVEKWIGLPFWPGPTMRMTSFNVGKAMRELDEHFHFIRPDGDEPQTIDWILQKAAILVMRFGIRGLIVDPHNEVEHRRPSNMTETEYISLTLSKLKRFAAAHGVHLWYIAHPRIMRAEKTAAEGAKTPVPTLYDISGSANWANKADIGMVVHRGDQDGTTKVYIRKCRFKWVGRQGKATLGYDKATGIYSDRNEVDFA